MVACWDDNEFKYDEALPLLPIQLTKAYELMKLCIALLGGVSLFKYLSEE